MKKILVVCLAFWAPFLLSAQISSVFEEDMNAIKISGGLERGKEVAGFSCQLGMSIKSRFEIEAQYTKTNFNTQDQYTYDAYINGLSGTVSWWLLKQPLSNNTLFNVGLKAGYESNDFKDYMYWEPGEEESVFIEYDGYSVGKLGVELAMNHWLDDRYLIRPSASIFGEMGRSGTVQSFSESLTDYMGVTGKIGAYLMKKINYNDVVYLYPSLMFNHHKRQPPVVFNLSIGFMVGY